MGIGGLYTGSHPLGEVYRPCPSYKVDNRIPHYAVEYVQVDLFRRAVLNYKLQY